MKTTFNIALVDDQEMTRITLGSLLERRLDASVSIKVKSGRELLRYLERGESPDLVITDLAMPDMGGITLCQILREKYPELKIMVLSIYKDKAVIDQLLEMGVHAYVNKDANLDEFIGSIQRVLGTSAPAMNFFETL
jgi:DNA-binding NarL/FixJ family response regulator